jgi:hypothetical protein
MGTNFSSLDHGVGFARHDDAHCHDDDDARATVFGTILQCPGTCTDTRLPFYHVTVWMAVTMVFAGLCTWPFGPNDTGRPHKNGPSRLEQDKDGLN